MSQVVFETTISVGERPKTYALDRVATGTGVSLLASLKNKNRVNGLKYLGVFYTVHPILSTASM